MAPQSLPPSLPPSVEEAYRRKCVQLKQRTGEVEEANDAARLRVSRIKRQVEKLRIERAFLLEQLAKRTSANVEDSDGSPSPPPTPKEKPLRTKRGHRKASMFADSDPKAASSQFLSQNAAGLSPSSESFSQNLPDTQNTTKESGRANGVAKPPKRPSSAFELYCNDMRPTLQEKVKEGEDINVDEEMARGWKDLEDSDKAEYQAKHDEDMVQYQKDKEAYSQKVKQDAKAEKAEKAGKEKVEKEKASKDDSEGKEKPDEEMEDKDDKEEKEGKEEQEKESEKEDKEDKDEKSQKSINKSQDEDVEMTNYDTEEQDTQADEKADD